MRSSGPEACRGARAAGVGGVSAAQAGYGDRRGQERRGAGILVRRDARRVGSLAPRRGLRCGLGRGHRRRGTRAPSPGDRTHPPDRRHRTRPARRDPIRTRPRGARSRGQDEVRAIAARGSGLVACPTRAAMYGLRRPPSFHPQGSRATRSATAQPCLARRVLPVRAVCESVLARDPLAPHSRAAGCPLEQLTFEHVGSRAVALQTRRAASGVVGLARSRLSDEWR